MVPDVDAAIARIIRAGGEVLMGRGATIMQGWDPQGAMFALVAPPR